MEGLRFVNGCTGDAISRDVCVHQWEEDVSRKKSLSSHYVTSMSIKRDDAGSPLTTERERKSGLEDEENKPKRKEGSL